MIRKRILLLFFIAILWLVPLSLMAAATVPLTQEEIEAILEKDEVQNVSSTTIPNELKRRINQAAGKAAVELPKAVDIAASSASKIIASSSGNLSSTTDKIKTNLKNMQAKVKAEIKTALTGRIAGFLSSICQSIISWIKGFFVGRGAN
jgi:predicted nucleic acid-binding protein